MNRQKVRKHKLNSEIRFPEVRVVGSGEAKLMSSLDAYKLAQSENKDLILINESQTPPIVRVEDYNKFLYNIDMAEKEKRKNAIKNVVKEIQLSCDIADNDLNTKSRKGKEFLEYGDKVKCVIQLKGRQKGSPERGEVVMLKFAAILEDYGVPEQMPKLEGFKWIMMMRPKKKG